MKKKALIALVERLGPAILAGGYARIIMKGYPLTITHDDRWHAALAFEPGLEMKWHAKTLLDLLEEGVRDQACPFDETRVEHWEIGDPEQEQRFQAFVRERASRPSPKAPPAKKTATKPQKSSFSSSSAPYEAALCHHCNGPIALEASQKGAMFCCDRCSEVAAIIRSARVSIKNGKYDEVMYDGQPSMTRQVTDLKIAFVSYGDGYPRKARYLTPAQKQAIMERDNYTCQMCGEEATDIDHIDGSSSDPSNLRALCKPCNVGRAIKKLPVLTPEQEERKAEIWEAIRSPRPYRLSHDETRWKHCWTEIKRIHKQVNNQAEREQLFTQLAKKRFFSW